MMIKRALDNIGITSEVAGSAKSAAVAAAAAAYRPSQKLPSSPSTALPPLRARIYVYSTTTYYNMERHVCHQPLTIMGHQYKNTRYFILF